MNTTVEILKSIDTPHGVVELRSDNILTFRPDVATFKNYSLEVLEALLEVFIEITDGVPRPYLCDNRYITGIVNKEEQAYMNKHFDEFATHTAMITDSTIIKILVNSYNSFFKPKMELKIFKTETDAVNWLLRKSSKK